MNRLIIIFLILGLLMPIHISAYRFIHITGKDGLPHQQIESLLMDEKGMLWIGTRNGLSCYNGYNIISYFNQHDNPNSLSHNFIRKLFKDSKNRIWIGTYDGICMYMPATDDFNCYLPNTRITSIVETSSGKIICGGTQLFIYDEDTDEFLLHPRIDNHLILSMAIDKSDRIFVSTNHSVFYYNSSFSNETQINPDYFSDFITGIDGIIPLFFDSKGLLWMGRNGKGVMSIDFETGLSNIFNASSLSDGTVRVISEDNRGRIWLGTEKGISIINPDGNIEILQQNFVDKNKLNDNAIYDIVCDNKNNIWIGTYFGGINVLLNKTEQFSWVEAGYSTKKLKGKAVRKIIQMERDILWIATEDGGINIYNTITGDINNFEKISELGHNVHELFYDETTDELWIGTFRNGLFRYSFKSEKWVKYLPKSNKGLSSDAIFAIQKQKSGTVLIGTTQGLRYYEPENDQFQTFNHHILDTDFIYCLLIDNEDNIWIGTRYSGLLCIKSETREIKGWTAKANNSSLTDNYITCLYQDSNNRIWIGTNNGGLHYLDPVYPQIKTLDNELSLSKATICSIIEDKMGRLWITTSNGLYRFNKERSAFICYTVEDGLPVNQFNFSSSFKAQNELMYLGSVNGLISFNPKSIKEERTLFEVNLLNLSINNHIITTKDPDSPLTASINEMTSIKFSYNQSRAFSIEYAAISLDNTTTINYQVRLLGIDENWRNVGQERRFVGSNLPRGTYTLQIRANNSNEGWEYAPIKEIGLNIPPPFYLSIWAFLAYTFFFALIIYLSNRIISIRLKEKNAVKIANIEKENLEKINQTKMDFFTSVSHELKTPLSLIMAPLKYISKNQQLNQEARERLETAIKNTDKMVGLIDELVTFNKVETGNLQFYIQKGNPLDFIENIANLFKESALEKQISFIVHCENNDENVWFSASYLEKIVNNLLSNAIKFTPVEGKVFIHASITDNSDGYTYLRIEVKDTGIGIIKEEFNNIFEKYYQTKRGYNVNYKGWGLGLALVKKFTEIHKGNISIDSTIGEGSCFVVNLNVSESAFNEQNKIASDKTIVSINKYEISKPWTEDISQKILELERKNSEFQHSILFVEDNIDLLRYLSDSFSSTYSVYLTKNGIEALAIAKKYPIDLIISDVMMPEMDGNELCKIIKSDITTSHIPVILLTAKSETDDKIKGYESGADGYVEKPFDPNVLALQIKNTITIKQLQREKISEKLGTDVETESLSKIDKEFLNKLNAFIEKNIANEEFSVIDITKTLGISRSVLHVKMKNLLNISMGDYIRKKRLTKACELLNEGYNISETAFNTGFIYPSYFARAFKKEYGIKPTAFQKKGTKRKKLSNDDENK